MNDVKQFWSTDGNRWTVKRSDGQTEMIFDAEVTEDAEKKDGSGGDDG